MSTPDQQRKKAIESDLEKFAKKFGTPKPSDKAKVLDKSKERESK